MRLERLDLAPYGRFADRSIRFSGEAALHVLFGRNESGKTTTLSALGDLLFGFPRDTAYAFAHDQRLLRVGGQFVFADGQRLDLRRRKGNKDTLLDPQDRPVSEEPLRRALGLIDRRMFEAEFGLTAQSLRKGGEALLLAGGALAETLAAGSASLSALNAASRRLEEEAEALFGARRAATKPFYVALDAHAEADRRLREAIVTADALKAAEETRLSAEARHNDLRLQHEQGGRALERRKRALRVKAKLDRLDAVATELAALGDLPALPAAALAAARADLEADAAKQAEAERLAAADIRDAAAEGLLGLDPALLAQGAAVDALGHDLGAVRKAEEDLPRRLGEQARAAAELEDIARRLGLPDSAALMAATPSDAALARAKTLIETRERARERQTDAEERRRAALSERERLSGLGPVSALDPTPLKRRLDGFADIATEAVEHARARALAEREARALAEEAASLAPPVADLDALARASLPDEATLEAALRRETAAEEALRAADQGLAAALRAVEAAEAELRRRESGAAGATRADWDAARARREAALDALEGGFSVERLAVARALTLAADATVESVLADTARAARLQGAREDLAARRLEGERAGRDHAAALAARDAARAASADLWAASGLAPLSSAAMAVWRKRVASLLTRRAALEASRAQHAAAAARIAAASEALAGWLKETGATATTATFAEAHRAAKARLDELQAHWLAARERQVAAEQAEKAVAEAEAALARAESALAAVAADWPSAMQALRLRPEAAPEEAKAALAAWDELALPRKDFQDLSHRIETMRADIAAFERGVAEVVAAAAPSLAGARARDALPKLASALAAARKAEDERQRLKRVAAERAVARAQLEADRAALAEKLARLRGPFAAADDAALAQGLERLARRHALEAEREALARDLAAAGDGLDEAQLRAEAAEFDMAALPSQIAQGEDAQKLLLGEIGEAAAAARAAHEAAETLARGRDAPLAARERAEASGALMDLAERWLARAAAARLARRAVERHRAAAQDPVIARAGGLFAVATAGSFAGLAVGYGKGDEPVLVARRPGGETVGVEGLSEGARDQLFLALRLALLAARAGEPLPFVGDDLLASFDDERTRATLDLLAAFGETRQTILFTHHARVAELARGLAGRAVEVIEI